MKTKNLYSYPVAITTNVRITADASPAHIGRLQHAVDFIVPEGTPVYAACDGIVIDIKQDSAVGGKEQNFDSLGNYIEIEHSNEEYSIYEHIKHNGVIVRVGERIARRQLIAYSGNTGWMADLGPHLHFDVHTYFGEGPEEYKSLIIRWAQGNG